MKIKGGAPSINVYVRAEEIGLGRLRVRVGRMSTVAALRNAILNEISRKLKEKYPAAAEEGEDFNLPADSEIHFAGRILERNHNLIHYNIVGDEILYITEIRRLIPAIEDARARAHANNAADMMEEGGARRKSRKHRMRKHRRRRHTAKYLN